MYFLFVTNDIEAMRIFETVLHERDTRRILITVPNGFELIQFLQNIKTGASYPDLIILTPKFLRISGMDLLELLKTDDFYRLIPVLMLLPEVNDGYEETCRRLGSEWMPAPAAEHEWVSAVEKMCAACA